MAVNAGVKSRNLSLSPPQIKQFQASNLTFSSRAGGKFVCNQLPELGRLTKGNVRTLKNQLCAHGGAKKKQKANPGFHTARKKAVDVYRSEIYPYDVTCPHCNRAQDEYYPPLGKTNCKFCRGPMVVCNKPPAPTHTYRGGFTGWL